MAFRNVVVDLIVMGSLACGFAAVGWLVYKILERWGVL
jgi:hypothetical protein